jgi:hypothetical protein
MLKKTFAILACTLPLTANAAIVDRNYNVQFAANYNNFTFTVDPGDILRINNVSSSYQLKVESSAEGPDSFNSGFLSAGTSYEHTVLGPDSFTYFFQFRNSVNFSLTQPGINYVNVNEVPVPAAAWLFGSALAGLLVIRRKSF